MSEGWLTEQIRQQAHGRLHPWYSIKASAAPESTSGPSCHFPSPLGLLQLRRLLYLTGRCWLQGVCPAVLAWMQ
ncbi:hypothetical protein HaLaN_17324, partial [Haematococcus lacustris]